MLKFGSAEISLSWKVTLFSVCDALVLIEFGGFDKQVQ